MTTATRLLGATILSLGLLGAPLAARAADDPQEVVNHAAQVVADLRHDPEFGNARELLHRARAVLIVPSLYKGGFFVGGEGGNGVLLTHKAGGGWSEPAFYGIGSASFGLQIGLEKSEMVMFIMSQKALDAVMRDEFKIGADAGLAVVTLGSNAEVATTGAVGPDIVVWSSSSGAYGGITVNGSIIRPQYDTDHAYYGPGVSQRAILFGGTVANPKASGLVHELGVIG
jgi:lipid-binding SYLF domain-containing protein